MVYSRTYQPYIEAGEVGVPVNIARGIVEGARDVLRPYLDLRMLPLRSAILAAPAILPENELNPHQVSLNTHPHSILLTRRLLRPDSSFTTEQHQHQRLKSSTVTAAGVCLRAIGSPESSLSIVSVPRAVYESDLNTAVAKLAHELVHSVGFEAHCGDPHCLQYAQHGEVALNAFSLSQAPFCGYHAQQLRALE